MQTRVVVRLRCQRRTSLTWTLLNCKTPSRRTLTAKRERPLAAELSQVKPNTAVLLHNISSHFEIESTRQCVQKIARILPFEIMSQTCCIVAFFNEDVKEQENFDDLQAQKGGSFATSNGRFL